MRDKQTETPGALSLAIEQDVKILTDLHSRIKFPPESDAMQWLSDNLYMIAGQAGTAKNDLNTTGDREHLPHLGELYAGILSALAELDSITPAAIEAALMRTCGDFSPTYAELCLLPALLRAALVSLCRRSVTGEADGVFMGRAVMGMIALGSVDMEACEERLSPVHTCLLADPDGVYPRTAIHSRRYLRELCYRIARATGWEEVAVARAAIEAARKAGDPRLPGVAAYLTGHPALREPARRTGRMLLWLPLSLAVVTAALLAVPGRGLLLFWFGLLPLWEAWRQVLWPVIARLTRPGHLLQMAEPDPAFQAVVTVATLVPSPERAADTARHLRRLYYKNRGEKAIFLLLCDFAEADSPTTPSDSGRASALIREVERLGREHGDHFALIIRKRERNPREGSFAGRGRKMGAIRDLFAFIAGEEMDFYSFTGDAAALRRSTHCLTLDADTGPTLGSLRELMATASHPVNRAGPLRETGRITEGYGVLVPRLTADLTSAGATLFAKVMAGSGGVTAYDTATADPYQDTFGEAIFAGKGLIDIGAYRAAVADRLPEDRMLSHDLIEGEYLRCGLVGQVEFTDAAPPTAYSYLRRLARWVRGDWQNAAFLFRRFTWGEKVYRSSVGGLGKYKIADNLRRHLTPVMTLLCALMAAALRDPAACLYGAVFWAAVFVPFVRELASTYLRDGYFALSRRYFSGALTLFADMVGRLLFGLCLLPIKAFMILDATARAIYRSAFSGKKMLQWQTAAQVEASGTPLASALRIGLPCLATGVLFCLLGPGGVPIGLAFGFGLPVAVVSSRGPAGERPAITGEMRENCAAWAAAIWQFFEDYVTAGNHFLPPDNVQLFPVYRQARRTSPTNIGFYLLSVLSAADLGLIDAQGLYTRVARTVATIEKLPKYAGNLYNWYNTETLHLLEPPFVSSVDSGNFLCCLIALREGIMDYLGAASGMKGLADRIEALIMATDLSVFYDKKRRLFAIGIDERGELTTACYDFFMSESRLTSYWAVASGMTDKKHWGRLARAMSRSGPHAGPLSWTGTLFEYFMPAILLPGFAGSLTDEALRFCLYCQARRGREMQAPWGISESGFYAFDRALNYQYKAHGVQKNGVKRGLDKDHVVAPYATFLALPFAPGMAVRNLERLRRDGVYGRYGFYEAADYRDPERPDVVRSYMSHHMGMSLSAINNLLSEGILQQRFMRNPAAEAGAELLQEKVSKKSVMIDPMHPTETPERSDRYRNEAGELSSPAPFAAAGHLLTSGMMAEVVSDSGAGYLWAGGVELTRRSADPLRPQGIFTFVHCEGQTFSPTAAPLYSRGEGHTCRFEGDRAVFTAEAADIRVWQSDGLHPKHPGFVREITLANRGKARKEVELLCYFEPVMTDYPAYRAHPAFAKMGVSARLDKSEKTAFFSRQGRSRAIVMAAGFADTRADVRFLMSRQALMPAPGGLSGLAHFAAVDFDGRISHDPCFAARQSVALAPGEQKKLYLLIAQGADEEEAAAVMASMRFAEASLGQMRTAQHFAPQSAEGRIAAILMGQMRFGRSAGGVQQAAAMANSLSQNHLWGLGLSGDNPIVVVEAGDGDARRPALYVRIQKVFAPCGCGFDLVVLCADERARADIRRELERLFPGGVGEGLWLLSARHVSGEVLGLIRAAACHIAACDSVGDEPEPDGLPLSVRPVRPAPTEKALLETVGGGVADGAYYVKRRSPLPYSHILTNPVFGTLVSDTALGFSFYQNARENKLTPWLNDPSAHNDGERLLLKADGNIYDLVCGSQACFREGEAIYRGSAGAIHGEIKVRIDNRAAAKIIDVSLINSSEREVEILCAYYSEPVIGVDRGFARMLRPIWDRTDGLTVDNPYSVGFKTGMNLRADRAGGFPVTSRAALFGGDWQRSCHPDSDPCAAVVIPMKLPPHRRERVTFVLSAADSAEAARAVSRAVRVAEERERAVKLRVRTPDAYLDSFISDFAPTQIISGRLQGRCGFYQCGGAYGFRDQLQDVMGLILVRPDLARRQIVRAAAAQFEEGDVLHWWHQMPARAGGKKGVRTRCSDDLLWLPYVTAAYVKATGDYALLDVPVRYLKAPELLPGQQDSYIQPGRSEERGSIYDHCLRAIERAHNPGAHGLPLMGAGDWNDGFSEVGAGGRGESVWLALFMSMVIEGFTPLMRMRGDTARAEALTGRAGDLKAAVDTHAWDGDHYLRAFFDDGSPMGSDRCENCQIDLLPQSFAVLAGMPGAGRVERAMRTAYDRLVDRKNGLVRLFTPHFTRDSYPSPGYVAGYPPGIRENGGQYTHGAIWFVLALLRQGMADEAAELLSWINPLSRSAHPDYGARYLTEPYYMAADIYANPNTPGQGGWSIYTGAAGWYYQVVIGEMLGLKREGDRLLLSPNLPHSWDGYSVEAEIAGTAIAIEARRGSAARLVVDGTERPHIPLDGKPHKVLFIY